jgi:hypothetical protein
MPGTDRGQREIILAVAADIFGLPQIAPEIPPGGFEQLLATVEAKFARPDPRGGEQLYRAMRFLAQYGHADEIAELLLGGLGRLGEVGPALGSLLFSVVFNSGCSARVLHELFRLAGFFSTLQLDAWYYRFLLKMFAILFLTERVPHAWLDSIQCPWLTILATLSQDPQLGLSATIDTRLDLALFFRFLAAAEPDSPEAGAVYQNALGILDRFLAGIEENGEFETDKFKSFYAMDILEHLPEWDWLRGSDFQFLDGLVQGVSIPPGLQERIDRRRPTET